MIKTIFNWCKFFVVLIKNNQEKFLANPKIAPANMWNRKDINEFKAAIRKEGPEGIIKVGHGETVTVSKRRKTGIETVIFRAIRYLIVFSGSCTNT